MRVLRMGGGVVWCQSLCKTGCASDSPCDKRRQREADLLGGGVELGRAHIARDGLVVRGPQVLGAEVGRVGRGHGAVREGQPDAAVGDRDVDGDEVGHVERVM